MKTSILLVICLFSLAFAQTKVDILSVDDFTTGSNNIIITIPASPSFPISDTSIFTETGTNNILGGERDLQLTVESGPSGRVLISQVLDGEWNTATPNSASGFALMQWDGVDGSLSLSNNGLGNLDLTAQGFGDEFHANIETDLDTEYTFSVYSPGGGQCDRTITIPGTDTPDDYYIPFSSFSSGCDFSNVGAIEVLVEAFDNVDSILYLFAVSGEAPPTPSATPTRPPTASNTPTPSIRPSTEQCVCMCPLFTCGLIYARPGDDDDTIDDDTHDDDDLVFRPVYYGPGDDDFDNVIPDDDDDELISFEGGLSIDANDDDDVTTNSASMMTASVVVLVSIVALVM